VRYSHTTKTEAIDDGSKSKGEVVSKQYHLLPEAYVSLSFDRSPLACAQFNVEEQYTTNRSLFWTSEPDREGAMAL
jgi:hypothetical protein